MSTFVIPSVATGFTLAATTQSSLVWKILDFQEPETSCEKKDVTTMADTRKKYIPGKVIGNGVFKFKIQTAPDVDWQTIVGVVDTWTLTHPLTGAGTVHAAAAFSGFVEKFTPADQKVDDEYTGEVEICVSGAITYTAQS